MKQKMIRWVQGRNDSENPRVFGIAITLLAILAVLTVVILLSNGREGTGERLADQPTTKVRRGPLTISVSESGSINPRQQNILRNETGRDVSIIHVVPEGKLVEAGELLVELDSTALENQLIDRRLSLMNDKAELVAAEENLKVVKNKNEADIDQAELTLKFAKQDLENYLDGQYPKLENEAKARIKLAESELKQTEEEMKWSEKLFAEKYLSQSELQQDQLNYERAKLDLQLAKADLDLLQNYTKKRQIEQLQSDVKQADLALKRQESTSAANLAQAEANVSQEKSRVVEEEQRLARDEARLKATKIFAPIRGRVLYATSVGNRWRRNDDPIEIGTEIDQNDEIIYLPTASEFNAEIMVTEAELNKLAEGLPARVTVDSLPGESLTGKVSKIAQYADQDSRSLNPNLKLYETSIELDPNELQLRNGMSCLVEIQVRQFDDVLQIPVQSVTRRNDRPTVYVVESDDTIVPREVDIGMDNSRFVHVLGGLKEGEEILLDPPLHETRQEEMESESDDDMEDWEEEEDSGLTRRQNRERSSSQAVES